MEAGRKSVRMEILLPVGRERDGTVFFCVGKKKKSTYNSTRTNSLSLMSLSKLDSSPIMTFGLASTRASVRTRKGHKTMIC